MMSVVCRCWLGGVRLDSVLCGRMCLICWMRVVLVNMVVLFWLFSVVGVLLRSCWS